MLIGFANAGEAMSRDNAQAATRRFMSFPPFLIAFCYGYLAVRPCWPLSALLK
jgi:hypothetical protein